MTNTDWWNIEWYTKSGIEDFNSFSITFHVDDILVNDTHRSHMLTLIQQYNYPLKDLDELSHLWLFMLCIILMVSNYRNLRIFKVGSILDIIDAIA